MYQSASTIHPHTRYRSFQNLEYARSFIFCPPPLCVISCASPNMLGCLRRCPGPLRRNLIAKSFRELPHGFATLSRTSQRSSTCLTKNTVRYIRPIHTASSLRQSAAAQAADETDGDPHTGGLQDSSFRHLADNGLCTKVLIDTVTDKMGLSTMTEVQRLTFNEASKGRDMYENSSSIIRY